MSKVINEAVPDVTVTPVESGASVENVKRIAKGEFEMGLTTADVVALAIAGKETWANQAVPDLRFLWIESLNPVAYAVREDSGIKALAGLNGKDFSPGLRGSATEAQTKKVLPAIGITPKWYVGGLEDATSAMKDKRSVGFVKAIPSTTPDASIMDVSATIPIRVLGWTPDQIKEAQEKYPYCGTAQIPAHMFNYDWNNEPLLSWSLVGGTVATTKMDEQLAYKIKKVVIEDNRPGGGNLQASAWAILKGVDLAKLTIENATTPLHVGALKYYREIGLQPKDAQIGPEAKR